MATAEKWQACYSFEGDELKIRLSCGDGAYNLPIVCRKDQRVSISEDKKALIIAGGATITSSTPMDIDPDRRIFHQVGGLAYLPIEIPVKGYATVTIK
jgi:hypothetical protein